ncbi:MAG: phosphate signaling complex protein PhoU [Clostridia bacterium]|nr:phosphate signaling complex protein PhoU [Clostridia bacterium]
MRNRFDEQLQQLNTELITMGALCEEAISCGVGYLMDGKENPAETVSDIEKQIDQKEHDIEMLCMKLLMQQQPVARDLRTISSALKMISDMERIGDQAADIAEIAAYVADAGLQSKTHIAEMAREAVQMVTDSVDSFVKKDLVLARAVIDHDDKVDRLFSKVKQEWIVALKGDHSDPEALIDLLMIAKYLERIGDHAENIAEWVIFSISGEHA